MVFWGDINFYKELVLVIFMKGALNEVETKFLVHSSSGESE